MADVVYQLTVFDDDELYCAWDDGVSARIIERARQHPDLAYLLNQSRPYRVQPVQTFSFTSRSYQIHFQVPAADLTFLALRERKSSEWRRQQ